MKKIIPACYALLILSFVSCKRSSDVQPQPSPDSNLQAKAAEDGPMFTYTPVLIAGKYNVKGFVNGTGTNARFNQPQTVFVNHDGTLLIADYGNTAVRKILSGTVSTVVNAQDDAYAAASATDGTIAVLGNSGIDYYKNNVLKYSYYECFHCALGNTLDKDPSGTSFWYTDVQYTGLGGTTSAGYVNQTKEFEQDPLHQDFLLNSNTTALSVCPNGYKYFTTEHSLYSYKAGVVHHILSHTLFDGITGIVANHDGSIIYLADGGDIKRVTQCMSGSCPTILTVLVHNVAATDVALSISENVLFYTSSAHNTVSKIALP